MVHFAFINIKKIMEFFGYLAPIAFVFALAALAGMNELKKEVKEIKDKLNIKEEN